MNKCLWLMLAAGVFMCAGCIKTSSTITEEISLAEPSMGGDGKVLDPNLCLTVMRPTPCRVTLRDSAGRQLFAQTVPGGKSVFTIAVERGSLLIKRASGETLANIPVSAPADAVLKQESDLSKLHQGTSSRFSFRVGSRASDPLFDLIVDRGTGQGTSPISQPENQTPP